MKMTIKKEVKTAEDWFHVAPPKGGKKQWKEFYSAMELALYFTKHYGKVPKEIDKYLKSIGIVDNTFEAEPEAITSLSGKNGFFDGEGRHHDLLIIGKDSVIGIEAKASESLDDYVTEKYDKRNSARYPKMCEEILERDISECSNVRYQLLSATAGVLIEARKNHKSKAVLLIVIFDSERVRKTGSTESTKADVEAFKELLESRKNERGAYNIHYAEEIDFYIDVLVVDTSSYR